ncbi:MAG: tRNA pseudouridine(38-40) synthase TruA [Flavobacteriales bacterium]|nr:tRNA pseudouridine(38-40) synthase TruA [Flavobacteriales bacterium]
MRYFMKLAYNGTDFNGWQIQDNAPSIQQEIEEKLSTILQVKTPIVGCGRTDTGVHAKQYFAHFEAEKIPLEFPELQHKLNSMLPWGIAIQSIFPVTQDAHARFSAAKRSYEYRIITEKNPFEHNRAYRFNLPLDIEAMNNACQLMLGEQDFGCFCKSNSDNMTDICTVYHAKWSIENNLILFNITANRFLRNMVRAIVGTLLEVGQNRMSLEDFQAVLDSKDRKAAGRSVPAHGLYLTAVEYPQEIFLQTP